MPTRDDRVATLEAEIRTLVDREWRDVKAAAELDAIGLLRLFDADLDDWASQLASGEMDERDVEFLMKARMDGAELRELKRLGLAKAKRDKLVNGIVQLAMKALSKLP